MGAGPSRRGPAAAAAAFSAPPPTGSRPPPSTDEEMARRLQAEWSAPAAPPTFPMEPVFNAPPGTTVTVQQHASAEEAYAHALALVNAHVPASAAPPRRCSVPARRP